MDNIIYLLSILSGLFGIVVGILFLFKTRKKYYEEYLTNKSGDIKSRLLKIEEGLKDIEDKNIENKKESEILLEKQKISLLVKQLEELTKLILTDDASKLKEILNNQKKSSSEKT
jgi:hypothetical protein